MSKGRTTVSSMIRVTVLSAVLSASALLIMWDYHQVNNDFQQLKALLKDVRSWAVRQNKVLVVRFNDKAVWVTDHETVAVISTLAVPTLNQVNDYTTLGNGMIVSYNGGTGKFKKRIHGGDIRSKR